MGTENHFLNIVLDNSTLLANNNSILAFYYHHNKLLSTQWPEMT